MPSLSLTYSPRLLDKLKQIAPQWTSKTGFLLIGTKQQRLKFSDITNLSLTNDIYSRPSYIKSLFHHSYQ